MQNWLIQCHGVATAESSITLFSVLNGDSMLDVFDCIYSKQFGAITGKKTRKPTICFLN